MGDFTYRNKSTGQIATFPAENIRLENLPNWETLAIDGQSTPEAAKYEPDGSPVDQFGAGRFPGMIGSTDVGSRTEERHQVPAGTPDPLHPAPSDPGLTPWTGDPAAPADPPQTPAAIQTTPPQTPASRPAQSALKPDWVAWAVSQGAAPADAEAMTKQDLIDHYYSIPGSDA